MELPLDRDRQPARGQACRCPAPRRSFLALLAAGTGGLLAGVLLWPRTALAGKIGVKLSKLARLRQVGGWLVVTIKGHELLLIRDTATTVRAMTSRCSHKNTGLTYDATARQVVCPKHGSRFSVAGKVLKGPAERPLSPVHDARLDGANDRVIIDL